MITVDDLEALKTTIDDAFTRAGEEFNALALGSLLDENTICDAAHEAAAKAAAAVIANKVDGRPANLQAALWDSMTQAFAALEADVNRYQTCALDGARGRILGAVQALIEVESSKQIALHKGEGSGSETDKDDRKGIDSRDKG